MSPMAEPFGWKPPFKVSSCPVQNSDRKAYLLHQPSCACLQKGAGKIRRTWPTMMSGGGGKLRPGCALSRLRVGSSPLGFSLGMASSFTLG